MLLKEQVYVCTLAEEGTISEAAKKLYITQPALSTFISKLEKTLGQSLFERRNGIFVPTYLGEKYIETAKAMLKLQDDFNLEQSLIVKNSNGRLRIGVQTRRSPQILPELIVMFKEKYPNIVLTFEESNTNTLEKLLNENKLDIIISSISSRKEHWYYEHIYNEELLAIISKNNPIVNKLTKVSNKEYKNLNFDSLKNETLIIPHIGQSLREDMEQIFKNENYVPKEILEIRSIETITKLVGLNFGVGFTRESYAKDMNDKNVEYCTFNSLKEFDSELVIACHRGSMESKSFKNMVEDIKELLKKRK